MACVSKRRGRWVVDYRIASQRKIASFRTRDEAEAFKRELLLRPLDHAIGFDKIEDVALREAAEQYLKLVSPRKSVGSQKLEVAYFNELLEFFGERPLSRIMLDDLEAYQLHLRKRVSAATVNRTFNVIKNFFRRCEDWSFLHKNPALKLKNLKEVKKPIKIWQDDEIQKVIEAAPRWASDAFYFAAKTGARRGEISALTWDCVDLVERTIQIKSFKGGDCRIRTVPMTDDLHAFLLSLRNERTQNFRNSKFVFLNGDDEPLSQTHLSTAMNRAAKRAGLTGLGLHSLRHSVLTKMAASNHSLRKIQQLAGHSSMNTTERYLHLVGDTLRESLESLEDQHRISPMKAK